MTVAPGPKRQSSGYSLDEAARMRRLIVQAAGEIACPRCAVPTVRTRGSTSDGGAIWFLHCDVCGRSVVIAAPEGGMR